jgi:hypothetical protein
LEVASSFRNVGEAEKVISDALRSNATRIRSWAINAGKERLPPIIHDVGKDIGFGVVRATGKFETMRKVLIVLRKTSQDGKLYFVLTAYPIR